MISTSNAKECTRCEPPKVSDDDRSLCVCPRNYYSDANGKCMRPCPLGIDCLSSGNDITSLNVIPGWWRYRQDSTKVYSCPLHDTCIGGRNVTTQCANGSYGVLCGLCKPNFQPTSTTCSPCPKQTWTVYLQFIGLLIVGIGFLMIVLKSSHAKGDGFIRPFIQLWQDLSIYMMFEVKFPQYIIALNAWTQIQVNFVQYVSPACAGFGFTFYHQYLLLLLLFVMLCMGISRKLWMKLQNDDDEREEYEHERSKIIHDVFIIVLMFYPSICGLCFRFFRCRIVGSLAYLTADLSLQCYDSNWWVMFVLILLVILLFVFGLPLGTFIYLRKHQNELEMDTFVNTIGSVYLPYKASCYFMEPLYMIVKLLMWATLVFFRSGSALQFACSVLLSVFNLSIQLVLQPFKDNEVNKMQIVNLSLGVVTAVVSLCFKYISSLIEGDRIAEDDLEVYLSGRDILGILLLLFTIISYLFFIYKISERHLRGSTKVRQIVEMISQPSVKALSNEKATKKDGDERNIDAIVPAKNLTRDELA